MPKQNSKYDMGSKINAEITETLKNSKWKVTVVIEIMLKYLKPKAPKLNFCERVKERD